MKNITKQRALAQLKKLFSRLFTAINAIKISLADNSTALELCRQTKPQKQLKQQLNAGCMKSKHSQESSKEA
ncbi:hypothetical protein ACT3TY_02030 [Halomonas sp. AOP22-C1-8]|uniref:hypothetical protein n=1 Tax=Halomonas sp. AOP22-C1-8 TaxID=3457717 RepID=UPI004034862A